MIVVDTDVIAAFWIKSDRTRTAVDLRRRDSDWIAPILWRSEIKSILRQHLVHGSLDLMDACWIVSRTEAMLRRKEYNVNSIDVLHLVHTSHHSSYDCEFVSLAQSIGCKLVTGDRKLSRCFPDTAVLLEDFVR